LVVLLGWSCWYKRFMFCLGHFGQLSTKYFSSAHTISLHLYPLPASWAGSHAVVTCLLICVSVHALFYEAIVAGTTFVYRHFYTVQYNKFVIYNFTTLTTNARKLSLSYPKFGQQNPNFYADIFLSLTV